MNNDEYIFQEFLAPTMQKTYEDIKNHVLLGASQQISKIADMLKSLCTECISRNCDLSMMRKIVLQCAHYYMKTRGSASRSIYNSVLLLINGLETSSDIDAFVHRLNLNIDNLMKENKKNLDIILSFSVNELSTCDTFMLFDYSSTIDKVIRKIASSRRINILIPESSSIRGGAPYLSLNKLKNVNLSFFPDAAIYFKLKQCDCVLMGAETFYPNGSGFNTIGSDMVGMLCKILGKKLYFITPFIKLDIRSIQGIHKELVRVDYKPEYCKPQLKDLSIETCIPELIEVTADCIYSYITEYGVLPSSQIFNQSMEYYNKIKVSQQ